MPSPSNAICASEMLYEKSELSDWMSDGRTTPEIVMTCFSPLTMMTRLPLMIRLPLGSTESTRALSFAWTEPLLDVPPVPVNPLEVPSPNAIPGDAVVELPVDPLAETEKLLCRDEFVEASLLALFVS